MGLHQGERVSVGLPLDTHIVRVVGGDPAFPVHFNSACLSGDLVTFYTPYCWHSAHPGKEKQIPNFARGEHLHCSKSLHFGEKKTLQILFQSKHLSLNLCFNYHSCFRTINYKPTNRRQRQNQALELWSGTITNCDPQKTIIM
ncbi:hypothetical protein DPEC_G00380090 [Dallia pectoralis]|nr:hypothetical protein DPEC_G00380090 [Dallia pectoralis]